MWSQTKRVCGLFALSALLTGCGAGGSDDVPIIRDGHQYQEVLLEAQKLSQQHLEAFHRSEDLDHRATSELSAARKLFQGLMEFNGTAIGPVFGAAEIDFALGNLDSAKRNYRQAINLEPAISTAASASVVAESHNQLANVLILQQDYATADQEASIALQLAPKNAGYMATLASAKVQLGQKNEAQKLCMKALAIDPENGRALGILKLLQAPDDASR